MSSVLTPYPLRTRLWDERDGEERDECRGDGVEVITRVVEVDRVGDLNGTREEERVRTPGRLVV